MWTTESVLALAPDPSAAQAGRKLGNPAGWSGAGRNERAVWGEIKGSGANPYRTAVDFDGPAYSCTCPSRKFPCKHALGLMLAMAQDGIAAGTPPEWVTAWLDKRAAKAETKPKADAPADPEAARKRSEKREGRIAAGLQELDIWLRDTVRQGLLSAAAQGNAYWSRPAARMVDAQAPGVARRVAELPALIGQDPERQARTTMRLGQLYMLARAAERLEELPPDVQADVRAALGWTLRKEELPPEGRVEDRWTVVGQRVTTEDKLRVLRTWLHGERSGRWALVLAFSAAGRPFDFLIPAGVALECTLSFYPGALPLRAAPGEGSLAEPVWPAGETIASALAGFTRAVTAMPLLEAWPMAIAGGRLAVAGDRAWLVDSEGAALPLPDGFTPIEILVRTGNHPATWFGEWDGLTFVPVGVGGRS